MTKKCPNVSKIYTFLLNFMTKVSTELFLNQYIIKSYNNPTCSLVPQTTQKYPNVSKIYKLLLNFMSVQMIAVLAKPCNSLLAPQYG